MAVRAIVGSRVIRPITSAANAWTSALTRIALPSGTPSTVACRNRARNDSPAASDHTIVDRRATGMPSIAARSPRSAAARTARPVWVAPRNRATPTIASGATMAAIRSLALSTTEPISNVQSNGAAMRSDAALRPQSRGVMIASTTRSVAMPIVATVSTRRDALRKRRTSATSTTAPSTQRADQTDAEPEPVRPAPEHDEADGEGDGRRAEVGLGEVDDTVGAVDERQADGQQRGQHPEHDAAQPEAERHAEEDELDGEDRRRRGDRRSDDREPRSGARRGST